MKREDGRLGRGMNLIILLTKYGLLLVSACLDNVSFTLMAYQFDCKRSKHKQIEKHTDMTTDINVSWGH